MGSVSLFAPVVPDSELHPSFKWLLHPYLHAPTRELMQSVFDAMPAVDGNFVRDFQTEGFDARVWELYLYTWGTRSGYYEVYRPHERPDFRFSRNLRTVWIEAVTAGAQGEPPRLPPREDSGFERARHEKDYHYIPQRLGSPLYKKLRERYWELDWVSGLPFLIAIEDFHDPFPVRDSSRVLAHFLYGFTEAITSGPGEPLARQLRRVPDPVVGSKKITAGFFDYTDAENISGVLFSNSGTAPKFSRMGYDPMQHGFLKMIRAGQTADFDPNAVIPEAFAYLVGDGSYEETWGEGMELFHNPRAKIPVPPAFFPDAVEHRLVEDRIESRAAGNAPYWSVTAKFATPDGTAYTGDEPFQRLAEAVRERLQHEGAASQSEVFEMLRRGPDI